MTPELGKWTSTFLASSIFSRQRIPQEYLLDPGLSIKPRPHYSKIDMLKEMMRAWGLEPEKILTREALAEPYRAYGSSEERENEEARRLGLALKENLKKELLACFSQTLRSKK